jgi:hypothetical protein
VTLNCVLYIRTQIDFNLPLKLCDYFVHIHVINIFKIIIFLLCENNTLYVLATHFSSCCLHFIMVLYNELQSLTDDVTYQK